MKNNIRKSNCSFRHLSKMITSIALVNKTPRKSIFLFKKNDHMSLLISIEKQKNYLFVKKTRQHEFSWFDREPSQEKQEGKCATVTIESYQSRGTNKRYWMQRNGYRQGTRERRKTSTMPSSRTQDAWLHRFARATKTDTRWVYVSVCVCVRARVFENLCY